MRTTHRLLLAFMLLFYTVQTDAQKLPNKQEASVRVPADVKIDGKINEWGNSFEAYNHVIDVFYTIANDDDNLYLIIHTEKSAIISKILQGGLRVTINPSKRNEKGAVSITFPVVGQKESVMMSKSRPKGIVDNLDNKGKENEALRNMELARYEANKNNLDKFKLIKVLGIKSITDTLISIYNEDGIKVAAAFDEKHFFNYELAISLKYLDIASNGQIYYNITTLAKVLSSNLQLHPITVQGGGPPIGPGGVDLRTFDSNTDFWGEYRLAKKP